MTPRRFHVSEEAGIRRFKSRPSPSPAESGAAVDCVWAVDEAHLRNYLFLRDCPRITYAAGPGTSDEDRARFLCGAASVAAIEAGWFERLTSTVLRLYEFAPEPFTCSPPSSPRAWSFVCSRTSGCFGTRWSLRP
jgi:hypothetical protein